MPKRASRDNKEEVTVIDDDEGAGGASGGSDLVELSSSGGEGGEEGNAAKVSAAHETLEISSGDEDEHDGWRGRSSGGASGNSKLEALLGALDLLRVGAEKPGRKKGGSRKSAAGNKPSGVGYGGGGAAQTKAMQKGMGQKQDKEAQIDASFADTLGKLTGTTR